ncbi:MAG: NAD-dependent epimerase/dehydratase family protein [Candidatus Adiutrix sp.]
MNHNSISPLPKIFGKHVITGAFGYTGAYLARKLFAAGGPDVEVHTLSKTVPADIPHGLGQVKHHYLDFDNQKALVQSLYGTETLYNTYWVRFNHKNFTYAQALINSKNLFAAAKKAQVKRVVHISITNPNIDSPFEYFRGKAALEAELKSLNIAHTILRPAVLFGGQDILINNIAWALRTFPILGIFGKGDYKIRPIYVGDLASLMVLASQATNDETINAVGPESFSYRQLIETLGQILTINRPIVSTWPPLAYVAAKAIGWLKNDVFLTWDEVGGLMAGLLDTPESFEEAKGRTLLSDWAKAHKNTLGLFYAPELARR